MRRAGVLLAGLLLSGCVAVNSLPPLPCQAGLKPTTVAELYFGRDIGTHEGVSDADWQAFVAQEIAPRFADGFTLSDAEGQWRGPDGRIVRERGKRLTVILSGRRGENASLAAIRAAYKARFRQDSVLEVESRACAGF